MLDERVAHWSPLIRVLLGFLCFETPVIHCRREFTLFKMRRNSCVLVSLAFVRILVSLASHLKLSRLKFMDGVFALLLMQRVEFVFGRDLPRQENISILVLHHLKVEFLTGLIFL